MRVGGVSEHQVGSVSLAERLLPMVFSESFVVGCAKYSSRALRIMFQYHDAACMVNKSPGLTPQAAAEFVILIAMQCGPLWLRQAYVLVLILYRAESNKAVTTQSRRTLRCTCMLQQLLEKLFAESFFVVVCSCTPYAAAIVLLEF